MSDLRPEGGISLPIALSASRFNVEAGFPVELGRAKRPWLELPCPLPVWLITTANGRLKVGVLKTIDDGPDSFRMKVWDGQMA